MDGMISFHSLTKEDLTKIVDIQLERVAQLMQQRGLRLQVDQSARDYLVKEGYGPDFGARPLKRTIQREVQDPLALKVISGEISEGDTIQITSGPDGLNFSIKETEKQPD